MATSRLDLVSPGARFQRRRLVIVIALGRGKRTEATVLGGGQVARLSFDYAEFFWFFSIAANFTWEVVGRDPADDVVSTREEIEAAYNVTLTEPGFWTRYSFVLAVAVALIAVLLVA